MKKIFSGIDFKQILVLTVSLIIAMYLKEKLADPMLERIGGEADDVL